MERTVYVMYRPNKGVFCGNGFSSMSPGGAMINKRQVWSKAEDSTHAVSFREGEIDQTDEIYGGIALPVRTSTTPEHGIWSNYVSKEDCLKSGIDW